MPEIGTTASKAMKGDIIMTVRRRLVRSNWRNSNEFKFLSGTTLTSISRRIVKVDLRRLKEQLGLFSDW
jgi:hypothetical protein